MYSILKKKKKKKRNIIIPKRYGFRLKKTIL
jgi:hypothetical protein